MRPPAPLTSRVHRPTMGAFVVPGHGA